MYLPGPVNAVTVSVHGTTTTNRSPSRTTDCRRSATRSTRSGAHPVFSMTHSSTISLWSQVPNESPGSMSKSLDCTEVLYEIGALVFRSCSHQITIANTMYAAIACAAIALSDEGGGEK